MDFMPHSQIGQGMTTGWRSSWANLALERGLGVSPTHPKSCPEDIKEDEPVKQDQGCQKLLLEMVDLWQPGDETVADLQEGNQIPRGEGCTECPP